MESKTARLKDTERRTVVTRGCRGEEKGRKEVQRAQTSRYKMNEFWDLTYSTAVTANNTVTYQKVAERVSLKCPHHKREMAITSHDAGSS